MKLCIIQPYLFPYIGYFQLINYADKFVVYDDVNFINKGWINRNRILLNGQAHMFTVPLKNASQNVIIKDLKIAMSERWKNKFEKPAHSTLIKILKKYIDLDLDFKIYLRDEVVGYEIIDDLYINEK